MAEPRPTATEQRHPGLIAGAAVIGALLIAACASSPAPAPKASAKAAEPPPAGAPQTNTAAPAPTPSTVGEPVAARVQTNDAVVIDEGSKAGDGPQTLATAAASERARRRQAGSPALVITNDNLAAHATGKLTISQGNVTAPPPSAAAPAATAVKDEQYWRGRVRALREQWALAVDAITELEARAAGLRTRFYAQDDPYVRDGEIKPAWDRALENLDASRDRARTLEEQLFQTLEEGRQAGALPGWLREGVELEPTERPYEVPPNEVARDDTNLVREPEDLGKPPQR
jgi:hypothetical protein